MSSQSQLGLDFNSPDDAPAVKTLPQKPESTQTKKDGRACPLCKKIVDPWELTVVEDGVWVVEACEKCAKTHIPVYGG